MEEDNSLSAQLMKFFNEIKIYFDLRIDYLKLQVAEHIIKLFSSIALLIIVFAILFFAVFFGSFAFAYWFGETTGKWALGYLIVAGFYILLALFVLAFRKIVIVRPFTRLILNQMEFDQFKDLEK